MPGVQSPHARIAITGPKATEACIGPVSEPSCTVAACCIMAKHNRTRLVAIPACSRQGNRHHQEHQYQTIPKDRLFIVVSFEVHPNLLLLFLAKDTGQRCPTGKPLVKIA